MAIATVASSTFALCWHVSPLLMSARTVKANRSLNSPRSISLSTNFLSPFPSTGGILGLKLQPRSLDAASLQWWKRKQGVVNMGKNVVEEWKQTALLVIDMQNDYILEDRPMTVKSGNAILLNVIKTVKIAGQRGILVVWVVREHDHLGRDVELFRRHFYSAKKGGPATKGTEGAEMVDGLEIRKEDYKLVKTRFSAFFDTNLHTFLQSNGVNNLVVVGIQTPNCIRQTVFDAVSYDYQSVTVIIDATAATTPERQGANIFDMRRIGIATPMLREWSKSNA